MDGTARSIHPRGVIQVGQQCPLTVRIWTVYLAALVMSARAAATRKIILEEDRIGWHNGWRRGVKWYLRSDVVAA